MAWLYPRLQSRDPLTADEIYANLGMTEVVGVAIVGQKPIAGPVCAGAVILPINDKLKFLSPMKDLSGEDIQRVSMYIKNVSPFTSVGWGSVADIQNYGIDRAIEIAVAHALKFISFTDPKDFIILDSYKFPAPPNNLADAQTPILSIDKARDFIEPVIAAHILATAARNAVMISLARDFPEYDWENNKGYATPMHIEAIRMHGYSSFHRSLDSVKSLKGENIFLNAKLKRTTDKCMQ